MSIFGVVYLHLFEEKISEQSVTKHTFYLLVTRDISFQSDFALLGKRYRRKFSYTSKFCFSFRSWLLYELTPLPTYYKSIDFPSRNYGTRSEQNLN